NIRAEIQLARQQHVSARMPRQEGNLAAFERAENVGVGRVAKRRLQPPFVHLTEPGHVVQTTAADNSNLCLLQLRSDRLENDCGTGDYTRSEVLGQKSEVRSEDQRRRSMTLRARSVAKVSMQSDL